MVHFGRPPHVIQVAQVVRVVQVVGVTGAKGVVGEALVVSHLCRTGAARAFPDRLAARKLMNPNMVS